MKRTSTLTAWLPAVLVAICIQSLPAQWTFRGSPEKGIVSSTRSYGDTILLTSESGIFFSTDDAASWTSIPVPDTFITMHESWIVNQYLFLSCVKVMPPYITTRQVYRTSDWGQSWADITPPDFAKNAARKLYIQHDSIAWFGDSTILLSRDYGDTYQIAGPPQSNPKDFFSHQGAFYVFRYGELLRTTAFDAPWELMTASSGNLDVSSVSLVDDILWKVEKDFWLQESYLSRSYDGGANWVQYDTIITPRGSETRLVGDADKLFVVSNLDDSFYSSTDGGATWQHFEVPELVYGVCFHKGSLLLNTTEGSYITQDNGLSFSQANKGLIAAEIHQIRKAWNAIWVREHEDVYSQPEGTDDWIEQPTWKNLGIADNGYFMAYVDGIPSRSGDGGQSWTAIPTTIIPAGEDFEQYGFRSAGNLFFLNTSDWPRYTRDFGATWHPFEYDNNDARLIRNVFYNGKYMVITGHNSIFVSDDGISWENVNYNLEADFDINTPVRMHYLSPYYFLHSDGNPFRLHEDSTTWIKLNSPGPDSVFQFTPFSRVCPFTSYHNLLITPYHRNGVFISRDFGLSWESITGDLPDYQTTVVSVFDDELYLGVHGGVWKRSLDGLVSTSGLIVNRNCFSIVVSENQLVMKTELTDVMVDVTIYSSDGRMINSLRNHNPQQPIEIQKLPAGWYSAHVRNKTCESTLAFVKN